MPDLSSGRLFRKHRGFDGVRPITFIFQTRLWNKKKKRKAWSEEMNLRSTSEGIERCALQPGGNALKAINIVLWAISSIARRIIRHPSTTEASCKSWARFSSEASNKHGLVFSLVSVDGQMRTGPKHVFPSAPLSPWDTFTLSSSN